MLPRFLSPGDSLDVVVTIRDADPSIWRRLHVPADLDLDQLHDVLQIAFGWSNSHMHDFTVNEIRFAVSELEGGGLFCVDESAAPLGAVAQIGSTFLYRYDFGDDWEHEIKVEGFADDSGDGIVCIDGARACPPEDCGGCHGYAQLLETLANPSDPEYKDIKQWVGPRFNPEKFDRQAVNKKLASLAKRYAKEREKSARIQMRLAMSVSLLDRSRRAAAQSVNAIMTSTYWLIGKRIVDGEQQGKRRAGYGQALIGRLSIDLTSRLGRGFSARNLEQMRRFYLSWPIPQTPSAVLTSESSTGEIPQAMSALSDETTRQVRVPILDLPMPIPAPDGAEWIEAYRRWSRAVRG